MTFSIVGRSGDGLSWGVAVASKFLAVGAAVPAAVAHVGALATQADANVAWKGLGLSLLDEGATAGVTVGRLVEDDEGRDHRQIGVVDADGGAATYTGLQCLDWAGGETATGPQGSCAVQGNVLSGPEVIEAMLADWASSEGDLAHRLLSALAAGDAAGGDRRGRQSAALLVVREEAGYAGRDDVAVDLRVDDHHSPIIELARLLALNDLYLTASTEAEKVAITDELLAELEGLAREAGHPDFHTLVGCENYEMRVDTRTPPTWIDAKILAILRGQS